MRKERKRVFYMQKCLRVCTYTYAYLLERLLSAVSGDSLRLVHSYALRVRLCAGEVGRARWLERLLAYRHPP